MGEWGNGRKGNGKKGPLFRLVAMAVLIAPALLGAAPGEHGPTRTGTDRQDTWPIDVPPVEREFRAAWVATVANIDWPSAPGLPAEQQRSELLAILDRAASLNLNAIVLQVRPACDALYDSKLEPWSEYLTGQMGKPPEPAYDPLAFAVEEAHRRGIELHAWFNPYRARHFTAKSEISAGHVSKTQPDIVRQYGRYLWLDPGEKATQEHSLAVMLDVVRRYDLDGIHIDDYFYPYKERDAQGRIIDFPDEPSWTRYRAEGGKLKRDDWRRWNVDTFIERLYRAIKKEKRWVKFGISPFGIWRPGNPPQIKGFDQYAELYADARKWLREGWVDYYTPQLYWKIEQTPQSYPVLLGWWNQQNLKHRHLWPGNFTSRVGESGAAAWTSGEIVGQIYVTRGQQGAGGNVHFSMKAIMENRGGLADALKEGPYEKPALVPASTWLDNDPPGRPEVSVTGKQLNWKLEGEPAWVWVVQLRANGAWNTLVLPASQVSLALPDPAPDAVAVSAVDRCGNQGRAAMVRAPGR